MKEIGGYHNLELFNGEELYPNAVRLNLARSGLKYILLNKKYSKIYMPFYTCGSLTKVVKAINIEIEYYNINENFEPVQNIEIEESEAMLYTNYFGICNAQSMNMSSRYKNIIFDNAQAFFSKPINNSDTIYSPRKFFGVPDGGYLLTSNKMEENYEQDSSYARSEFLLKRIDECAENGYKQFIENENELNNQDIKKMSTLTSSILKSIDYQNVKQIREQNFHYLHDKFKNINELKMDSSLINGPMVYPLLISQKGLKEYMINNKVFIATYWKEVKKIVEEKSYEQKLVDYLLPLPIDQRYNEDDMSIISELIIGKLK